MLKSKAKQKLCRVCRAKFTPFNTLHILCGSPTCAVEYVKTTSKENKLKAVETARKRELREDRQAMNERDIGWHRKKADEDCNRYIRLRDGKLCISCGITTGQFHAGHYRPKSHYPEFRYDEDNIHAQCAQCNEKKSGNLIEYRKGLVLKIGQDRVDRLESASPIPRRRIEDYKQIRAHYRAKIKEMG